MEELSTQIGKLFEIVETLKKTYPNKDFTLDGRLVGDLGEVIAEKNYELKLYEKQKKEYDAEWNGKKIQIKATFKKNLTFPSGSIPELYLGIKLNEDGSFEEIFNGPGEILNEYFKDRKGNKNGYHQASIEIIKKENEKVNESERIPKRKYITKKNIDNILNYISKLNVSTTGRERAVELLGISKEFYKSLYDNNFIEVFNWTEWIEKNPHFQEISSIDSMEYSDIRKIITAIVRGDRFNEGLFESYIQNDYFLKLILHLKRLIELNPSLVKK